jgi:hypothetical protein
MSALLKEQVWHLSRKLPNSISSSLAQALMAWALHVMQQSAVYP